MTLPIPSTARWAPLRLGLSNLYKYDEEQFLFSAGRLLLRGENGTGKTRVLALTLPFLLDGEVRPSRVEPDADPSRRIEWHVHMDRYHERIGYAWLEFGRLENSQPRYCTLGCGMRALLGQQGLRGKWFFVSSARVGADFSLTDSDRSPLSHERLKQTISGRGTIYETAAEYRRAVDSALFGLGERRYAALVDLLLELRRPQLSRKLEEAQLSAALSQALSSLDESTINDLAEAYSGLEQDRRQLQSVEASVVAVRAFNAAHRRHVAAHAKRFSDEVRRNHHRYDSEQAAVREAQGAKQRAAEEARRAEKELEASETRRLEATTAEHALRQSPEMRTAGRLSQLRDSSAAAGRREQDDAQAGQEREAEALAAANDAAAAGARLEESSKALAKAAATSESAATRVGISGLGQDASPDRLGRLKEALRSRRVAAEEMRRFASRVRDERQRHGQENARVRAAEEQRDHILRAAGEANERLVQCRQDYLRNLAAWLESLVECKLDSETVRASAPDWLAAPQGESPLRAALAEAADLRQRAIAKERASQEHSDDVLRLRREALGREVAQLEAGIDPVPPALPHRDEAARAGRPGAPLWRLVDFKRGLGNEARAGYEAALQASGLLDGWVSPDGTLRLDPDGEAYLGGADAEAEGRTLDSILGVAIDPSEAASASISATSVHRILRTIGAEESAGLCWVSADGRWRNGPASGAWSKPAAGFVGAGARASARKSRLQTLAAEIGRIDAERRGLKAELDRLDAAAGAVRSEQQRAPSEDALRSSWTAVRAESTRLARAQEEVSVRQLQSAAVSAVLEQSLKARDQFAADARLADWIDRDAELSEALAALAIAVHRLGDAAEAEERSRQESLRVAKHLKEVQSLTRAAGERHQRSARAAAALATELRELEAAQGAAATAVLRRLDEVIAEARRAEAAIDEARETEHAALLAKGAAEGSEMAAQQRLAESAEQRANAIRILREVAAGGILAVLGGKHELPGASATDTTVLDLARSLARELKDTATDERSMDQLQVQANDAFQAFQRALSSADMAPTAEARHGILHVTLPFEGRSYGTAEVETLLGEEAAQRRQMLSAQERKIIETFLIDEAAAHLHDLIHEADRWVALVNRELESRPMSSGMALRFRWAVSGEAPEGAEAARDRLLRPSHAWSADDRQGLGDFLQRQIALSRERESATAATWQEQLSEALDYRRWHRFVIERKNHLGRWVPLTKRSHGTASGGEKAVALTMPQFAAAAAHYQAAPLAPRLILLDEAFVGIDDKMRRECMGLLAAFDLDVVMTSEREWGCYNTVPSLSIYQMAASGDCVATTRYVWDGKRRVREPDPA